MPAPYFPFALLAIDLVKAGPGLAIQSFTGIAAAHLWFFLTTVTLSSVSEKGWCNY